MPGSIYHNGEIHIQQQTGEREMAIRNAGMLDGNIPGGAAGFIQNQKFFFAASKDTEGRVWASVLSGRSGFVKLKEEQQVNINPALLTSEKTDVFWENIKSDAGIGLLFIELTTRRRLRVNGILTKDGDQWGIRIEQAYYNCPRYIQRRELVEDSEESPSVPHELKEWIRSMDTFFVASSNDSNDLDVSHRGGNPGFIEWINENTLRIPDYSGNSMFNTLGNFYANPSAGLLFVDFSNGDTVQMTGRAVVHFNESGDDEMTGETNRFWTFKIDEVVFKKSLYDFSMILTDYSRYNP